MRGQPNKSAAMAVSGVGRVEEETRRVREMVKATAAEAKSVRDNVESRVAVLAAAADASATRANEEIASRVRQVAEYSERRRRASLWTIRSDWKRK